MAASCVPFALVVVLAAVAAQAPPQCGDAATCKIVLAGLTFDLCPLCAKPGDEYRAPAGGDSTFVLNVGNISQMCLPQSYSVAVPVGAAVQFIGDAPPCGSPPQCTNPRTGGRVCCSAPCETIAALLFAVSLLEPTNPATGGVRVAFTPVPGGHDDVFACPIDPRTGQPVARTLRLDLLCDAAAPTLTGLNVVETGPCNYTATASASQACGIAVALAPPTLKQRVGVPSYWYPSSQPDSSWARALAASPPLDIVVINPDSGPGVAADPNYIAQVARAHAANMTVLGYTHTLYGKRALVEVRAEVDDYFSWFGVDGVFVDEVASDAAGASYYAEVAAYVRGKSARGAAAPLVVLNPGTDLDVSYNASFDIVMSFEDSLEAYRTFEPAAWLRAIAPERVWHCIHSAGTPTNATAPLAEAVARSKANNAGVVYVTNETMPNPYKSLPSGIYLEDLLRWAADDFDL